MDDFLPRATRLLQPLMSEERRGTWLALAFHGSNRAIHDAISQSGSTADFTVRCVRHLLDRGRVGSRHALSLLLETVRGDAGDELQEAFQELIDELDARCSARRKVGSADDAGAPISPPPSPRVAPAAAAAAAGPAARVAAVPPLPASGPPAAPGAAAAPRDFFISYNSHDKDWAVWIAWQLEAAGHTTLIQAWDFHAGSNFVVEMDRAARQSRRTIAVLSNDYLAAKFTTAEWAEAFARDPEGTGRVLLPVRVRDCEPEGLLRTIVYLDLLGLDEAAASETLLAGVGDDRGKPPRSPGFPGMAVAPQFPQQLPAAELPASLLALRQPLLAGQPLLELAGSALQEILRHSPRTLEEYRLARIAEWSQPRYALDKRFTRLTLLLDQGPDAQGTRWQARQTFDDLRDVLAATTEPALVVLGPPGCGKSTLLRRLELDLAADTLRSGEANSAAATFLVPLGRYQGDHPGEPPPLPQQWLAREWQRRYPQLPAFDELLRSGRLVLLLDALNELPHVDAAGYHDQIALWRSFLGSVPAGTRVLFSCRSLDYSAVLSTSELPVPLLRIEALADPQVEEFLAVHDPQHGPALWQQLRGTPQLDLFRSPFYLRLLLAQAADRSPTFQGKAALFTGFVRQTLAREIVAGSLPFRDPDLLRDWERECIQRHEWPDDPHELPAEGILFPALSHFAHELQLRRRSFDPTARSRRAGSGGSREARVRVRRRDALAMLDAATGRAKGETLLHAGVALQVLDADRYEVLFVHQLFQEYFAARSVAAEPQPALAVSAWRADEISPGLPEVLAELADSDPLPAAPATGWEETFVLAAAMARDPEAFVSALVDVNLPLAGRCAAQPDVAATLSDALRKRLRQALVARSCDPEADLRARIAAARALGQLGDPRFERGHGPDGDFLLPPLLAIDGGRYRIGSDEGLYADESPAHEVDLAAFAIARFPVTNGEWRLFIEAGGYDDERWWQDDAGQRWRRGDGTAEGPKQQVRANRQWFRDNPQRIGELLREGRITSQQAENWEHIRQMTETDFDALLEDWYPAGRQNQPGFWNDPAYNDALQPVVGICWHEARVYCAWLSAQTGQIWRLPSEAEWEAAARGRQGRRYAWGDDFDASRCNSFESHVRGTTPIGVFPAGDTPAGLADISGNVWEWTTTAYEPYPYAADPRREDPQRVDARRVVRGGSWHFLRDDARCATRGNDDPGDRHLNLGLRLVCVSPILKR